MPILKQAPATLTNHLVMSLPQILKDKLLLSLFFGCACILPLVGYAQLPTPIASPAGSSATQVLGRFDDRDGYINGKWIQILYGRPIKRERSLFDLPDWREALLDGAEVWRAGANVTTRLVTEVDLTFAGTKVPPGEYTVFIDFNESEDSWSFILSRFSAQLNYDYEDKSALWGAYEYTAEKDVVRIPMSVNRDDIVYDQLSWQFADVHGGSGKLVLLWDKIRASVEFNY